MNNFFHNEGSKCKHINQPFSVTTLISSKVENFSCVNCNKNFTSEVELTYPWFCTNHCKLLYEKKKLQVKKKVKIKLPEELVTKILEHRSKRDNSNKVVERKNFISKLRGFSSERLALCEMYPDSDSKTGVIASNFDEGWTFNLYWNTRRKLNTETIFEIDSLNVSDAVKVVGSVALTLIHNKIHFAIFFAPGQRSPHIRIYDWSALEEVSSLKREEMQKSFWKKMCPFYFSYLDQTVWKDGHEVALEFSPHWKTGETFDLVFEHIPESNKKVIKKPKKRKVLLYEDLLKLVAEVKNKKNEFVRKVKKIQAEINPLKEEIQCKL